MSEAVDRTNDELQRGDDLLTDICAAIVEGSTLTAFCAERALKYRMIVRWLNDDDERQGRYKRALELREHHAKDLIISELIAYLKARPVDGFERDEEGHQVLKRIEDMPPELQRLIAGIEFEEIFEWQGERGSKERVHVGRIHKIKFWDKPRSIEAFMKHLAMLIDRKEIKGELTLAEILGGGKEETRP